MSKLSNQLRETIEILGKIGHPSIAAQVQSLRMDLDELEKAETGIPSGFSRGPWVYGMGYKVRQSDSAAEGRVPPWGHTIADVYCDHPGPTESQVEANGQLIAMLPDLVEEVIRLRKDNRDIKVENGYLLRDLRNVPSEF